VCTLSGEVVTVKAFLPSVSVCTLSDEVVTVKAFLPSVSVCRWWIRC
jgi:hypothetical protein